MDTALVFVPGGACRPEALIDAVVLGIERWRRMVEREGEKGNADRPGGSNEVRT